MMLRSKKGNNFSGDVRVILTFAMEGHVVGKADGYSCDLKLGHVNSMDKDEYVSFIEDAELLQALELVWKSEVFVNLILIACLRKAQSLLVICEQNKVSPYLLMTQYKQSGKVDKHMYNFIEIVTEIIIFAVNYEHRHIETACIILGLGLNDTLKGFYLDEN